MNVGMSHVLMLFLSNGSMLSLTRPEYHNYNLSMAQGTTVLFSIYLGWD